ncbi:MAG: NAD(P)H-dependent oxidoreductase subunit E [Caldisericia bacterium]|nr:NAD(P)H-dependent oxidoreductase subunit E [Caldisericia bacterium]MDD4615305.1 NAD(P)H-dependent oxidoreductase subunit E [Caldisericia bacterium]
MESQIQQTLHFPQIDRVIRREGNSPEALIQILHGTQEILGYLPEEAQLYIAQQLKIPPTKVYGIVSFYNFFTMKKAAQHVISVCMGTACYVKGSGLLMKKLQELLGTKAGETTEDGRFSYREVRCLGACGMAPLISVDGDIYGRTTPDALPEILQKYTDQ